MPSLTDQESTFSLAFQPLRFFPLNIDVNPRSSAVVSGNVTKSAARTVRRTKWKGLRFEIRFANIIQALSLFKRVMVIY
jgi:hypothetical protein